MRAPEFWSDTGMLAQALRPLGVLAAVITARRIAKPGVKLNIPVICVGNINVGGTGKTPTVIALIERLHARKITVCVLSRGYGGSQQGPVLVDPARHSAEQVGDEPLLLAAFAPTIVARDRLAGAEMACAHGAQVIVLDDGMQNPSVHKDLSIVVVDAAYGFGNGFCLPAGPLREPVKAGLARADIVLSIGHDAAQADFKTRWGAEIAYVPHIAGALCPLAMGVDWKGARVIAFAGIGRPEKFFATLRAAGASILRTEALGDHARLPEALMARLLALARQEGALLVTTEKDAVRLPARYRAEVLTMPVRLQIASAAPLDAALIRLGL